MNEVVFLYDFASPNCYVALAKLKNLLHEGKIKNLKYSPVLLGGLFKNTNDAPVPAGSPEYNYMSKNLARLSATVGISFHFSKERFPVNSLKALRGSYFAKEAGVEEKYIQEVFSACWGQDQDITQNEVLRSIINDVFGLNFEAFSAFVEDNSTKLKLRTDTQNAYERGVFGAPTYFIDGEMYWGTPEILWFLESEQK